MAHKFDIHKLAWDIAEGRLSQRELADRHGLSVGYVAAIMTGRRCRDMQPLIKEAIERIRIRSLRRGASLTLSAWGQLERLIKTGDTTGEKVADEVQRKAAVDILKLAVLGDPSADSPEPTDAPDLDELSPETKARVLAELGGPEA